MNETFYMEGFCIAKETWTEVTYSSETQYRKGKMYYYERVYTAHEKGVPIMVHLYDENGFSFRTNRTWFKRKFKTIDKRLLIEVNENNIDKERYLWAKILSRKYIGQV
jgi:hypothetical protein